MGFRSEVGCVNLVGVLVVVATPYATKFFEVPPPAPFRQWDTSSFLSSNPLLWMSADLGVRFFKSESEAPYSREEVDEPYRWFLPELDTHLLEAA